jgi:hypothetical protein
MTDGLFVCELHTLIGRAVARSYEGELTRWEDPRDRECDHYTPGDIDQVWELALKLCGDTVTCDVLNTGVEFLTKEGLPWEEWAAGCWCDEEKSENPLSMDTPEAYAYYCEEHDAAEARIVEVLTARELSPREVITVATRVLAALQAEVGASKQVFDQVDGADGTTACPW